MTTITIADELVRRAIESTGAPTPDEAVAKVLDQLTPSRGPGSQADLIKYLGTFDDFMTPEELEKMRSMD